MYQNKHSPSKSLVKKSTFQTVIFTITFVTMNYNLLYRHFLNGTVSKQAPHLTQDTDGKVTTSQLDITNKSQEVSPFPAGDHKASINRHA